MGGRERTIYIRCGDYRIPDIRVGPGEGQEGLRNHAHDKNARYAVYTTALLDILSCLAYHTANQSVH